MKKGLKMTEQQIVEKKRTEINNKAEKALFNTQRSEIKINNEIKL